MIALVQTEWRRLLRQPVTPWGLLAYLAVPLGAMAIYLAGFSHTGLQPAALVMLGAQLLNLVGTWQILLLAAAAAVMGAGLLADELGEGTLPVLLAAGSTPVAIAGSKLLALILFLLVIFVAGLPLFAVPLLVGGITWGLVGRVLVLEVATIIAMSGLGLAISGLGRKSGPLALAALGLALALTMGSALISSSASPSPIDVYGPMAMGFLDSGMVPGSRGVQAQAQEKGGRIRWVYLSPLVGLNSAIHRPAGQGVFGLPGAGLGSVWRGYRLWQVQAGAAGLVALAGVSLAAITLQVRMRWRWRWPLRSLGRRAKEALQGGKARGSGIAGDV